MSGSLKLWLAVIQLVLGFIILFINIAEFVISKNAFKDGTTYSPATASLVCGLFGILGALLGIGGYFDKKQYLLVAQFIVLVIADIAQISTGSKWCQALALAMDTLEQKGIPYSPSTPALYRATLAAVLFVVLQGKNKFIIS